MLKQAPKSKCVNVSATGRMNLPASMRSALGLKGAGQVILTQDEQGIRISTMDHALRHIRELAQPFKPKSGHASDELIAERRDENSCEETGPREKHDG